MRQYIKWKFKDFPIIDFLWQYDEENKRELIGLQTIINVTFKLRNLLVSIPSIWLFRVSFCETNLLTS